MSLNEIGLIESARKLEEIERNYLRLSYESPLPSDQAELAAFANRLWKLGLEAFDLRNEIYATFSERTNIQIIDPKVRKTLDKVRNNENFLSINFFEFYFKEIENITGKTLSFPIDFDQFIESKYDEWYGEFYSRFHLTTYYKGIISIGPIFSSISIPEEAKTYFSEIREAYALELNNSAIALSRSVMEMCLFDKLQRKGYFKPTKVVKLDAEREDKLHYLIITSYREKLLDYKTHELAHEVRKIANKILHPKKGSQKGQPGKKETVFIISGLIKVVEQLYS